MSKRKSSPWSRRKVAGVVLGALLFSAVAGAQLGNVDNSYIAADAASDCSATGGSWIASENRCQMPQQTTQTDPAAGCSSSGGTWNTSTNSCQMPNQTTSTGSTGSTSTTSTSSTSTSAQSGCTSSGGTWNTGTNSCQMPNQTSSTTSTTTGTGSTSTTSTSSQSTCTSSGGTWNATGNYCQMSNSTQSIASMQSGCTSAGGTWDTAMNYCRMPNTGATPTVGGCTTAGGTWIASTSTCQMPNTGTNYQGSSSTQSGCTSTGGTWTIGANGGGYCTWNGSTGTYNNSTNYGSGQTQASCTSSGGTWKTGATSGFAGGSGWCEWSNYNNTPGHETQASCQSKGANLKTGTDGSTWCEWASSTNYQGTNTEASCKSSGGTWKTNAVQISPGNYGPASNGWCEWSNNYDPSKTGTNYQGTTGNYDGSKDSCYKSGGTWEVSPAGATSSAGNCRWNTSTTATYGNQNQYNNQYNQGQNCYGATGPCDYSKMQYDPSQMGDYMNNNMSGYEMDPSYKLGDHSKNMNPADYMKNMPPMPMPGPGPGGDKQMIKNYERNLKDFDQITKRIDKMEKELNKRIGKAGKYEGAANVGSEIQEDLAVVNYLKGEAQSLVSSFKTDLDSYKTTLSSQTKGGNYDYSANKILERYFPIRNSLETPLMMLEQKQELYDLTLEAAKVDTKLREVGAVVPEELSEVIGQMDYLKTYVPQAVDYYDQIKSQFTAVGSAGDSESREDAMQDLYYAEQDIQSFRQDAFDAFDEWRMNEPWMVIDYSYQTMDQYARQEDDLGELENIRNTLNMVSELDQYIKGAPAKVAKAIDTLEALRDKALPIVDALSKAFEVGAFEQAEPLWQKLDSLGGVAENSMMIIMHYCESADCGDFDFEAMMGPDGGPGEGHGPGYGPGEGQGFGPHQFDEEAFQQEVGQFYDEEALIAKLADKIFAKVTEKIQAELPQMFTKMFNETMADKIVTFMDENKTIDKLMTSVFDRATVLGEDKVKALVEDSTDLYEVASKFDDLGKVPTNIQTLVSRVENTYAASSVKEELADGLEAVYEAVKDGETPTKEIAEVNKLLDQNEKDLALVDKVEFIDVKLDGQDWYTESVISGLSEGVFSGDAGKGTFRPGDAMNKAEALKTVLEAAGEGKVAGAGGEWYQGYVQKANQLDLSIADSGNWGAPVTREELATMMYELGDFGTLTYHGEFQDIKANDPIAPIAAVLREEGIITGQQDGKYFNPDGQANRAEVATIINRFLEATEGDRLVQDLDNVDLGEYGLDEFEGADPTGGYGAPDPTGGFSDYGDQGLEDEGEDFSLLKVTFQIGGLKI